VNYIIVSLGIKTHYLASPGFKKKNKKQKTKTKKTEYDINKK